jgi:negative regulator of flagellin synthesis FlgM
MKVENSRVSSTEVAQSSAAKKTDKAKEANKKGTASATEILGGASRTEISSKAKEAAQAKSIATSAPDVREERVAALKKQIAEGKYKVDANAIADKLVDEHLATAGA